MRINVCVAVLLNVCERVCVCMRAYVRSCVCVSICVLVYMCECVMGSNTAQRLSGKFGSHIVLISHTDSIAPSLSMWSPPPPSWPLTSPGVRGFVMSPASVRELLEPL